MLGHSFSRVVVCLVISLITAMCGVSLLLSTNAYAANCSKDITPQSTRDAFALALRDKSTSLRLSCRTFKFSVDLFRFNKKLKTYELRGDVADNFFSPADIAGGGELRYEIAVSEEGKARRIRFLNNRGLVVRPAEPEFRALMEAFAIRVQQAVLTRQRECAKDRQGQKVRDHRVGQPECILTDFKRL